MRWRTLWLPALLVITISSRSEQLPKVIEQEPIPVFNTSSAPDSNESITTPSAPDSNESITTPSAPDSNESITTPSAPDSNESITTPSAPDSKESITTPSAPDSNESITTPSTPDSKESITTPSAPDSNESITTPSAPDSNESITTPSAPDSNETITTPSAPDSENIESFSNESNNQENDNSTTKEPNASENQPNTGEIEGIKDFIVDTKSGQIQGYIWPGNEYIISYYDIPYGTYKQPFQTATPAENWAKVHDVKVHAKRCPQLGNNGYYISSTDCLTLSIFKPLETKEPASVLFHIHADNFNTGSGNPNIYGPDYLVSNEIILVLPNYRLGPLGFLCMQNETAPGNMALKDLSLALNWIKENIAAFGGDPNNIAVSGDSQSGALAGFLALSSMSKGNVNKVIAESGSLLSYWALDRDPTATATQLFNNLQRAENAQSRPDISLEQFTEEQIVRAAEGIHFRPCVETLKEGAFLVEVPFITLTTQNFENTAFLLGSSMYAGVHEMLIQTEASIEELNQDFTLLLPNDLKFPTTTLRTAISGRVKEQYFDDKAISLEDEKGLSLCFTDIGYLGPGIRSARLLVAANATVYFYEFAYVGDMNKELESVGGPVDGAVRGDIVGYLFTQYGYTPPEESDDRKMVDNLITLWTNFLKKGAPTKDGINWNKLEITEQDKEEWLLIDSELTTKQGLHVDRMSLWTEIYADYFTDNDGHRLSSSVYTILIFQLIFWIGFWCNASHIY